MIPLPPWLTAKVIGYGLAVLVIAGGLTWIHHSIYTSGVTACETKYQAAMVESIKRAGEQARVLALQDGELLQQTEKVKIKREVLYRDRQVEVIKHVQTDCSLDPDGLRLLNDALSDSSSSITDTTGTINPMPKTRSAP